MEDRVKAHFASPLTIGETMRKACNAKLPIKLKLNDKQVILLVDYETALAFRNDTLSKERLGDLMRKAA